MTLNIVRAEELLERACSLHYVGACLEIARWYRVGEHVQRDIGRANDHYRRALFAGPNAEGVELLRTMAVGRVLDVPDRGLLLRRPRGPTNPSTKLHLIAPVADHLALDMQVLPASHSPRAVVELTSVHEDWRYESCGLQLWADEQPIRLAPPNYRRGSIQVREILVSFTTADQVWRLARANRVRGQVCDEEFALTGPQMLVLRRMQHLSGGLRNGAIPPERGSVCSQNAVDCR